MSSKKLAFRRYSVLQIKQKYLFRIHWFPRTKQKYWSGAHQILQKGKIRKTLSNVCDLERYPTLIWICKHLNFCERFAFKTLCKVLKCLWEPEHHTVSMLFQFTRGKSIKEWNLLSTFLILWLNYFMDWCQSESFFNW